jgi:predicted dehydrogenase/aryl-alcohol dehydrogenase-like predicted oxidoreductase
MADKLNWGILAAGGIARNFAKGVAHSKTGRVVAIGSRSEEKAEKFGDEFAIPRRHSSYEALLADPQVQAVYVATPHPMHAEWAIKAAEAGKHVLCEKPIGINHAEAMAEVEAAHRHGVFLMEAFMYRCSPQTLKLVELLRAKAVGEVRVIRASFSFHAGFNPESRIFANALGGGGILDVGCYPVSLARLVAGIALGKDFADPIEVKGCGHLGATGVDEWAAATLRFPGEIVAQVATGVSVTQDNAAQVFGTEGNILVPWPWIPSREGGTTKILLQKEGDPQPQEILVETQAWLYGIEADVVAANLDRRQARSPAMSWDDTLGNMRTLDRWRQEIGLVYDTEKPQGKTLTVAKRPLAVRPRHNMKYGRLAHLDKPVSRLVMGVDNQTAWPHASVMFDDFFEQGGNAFDTAYVYGGWDGPCERILGWWVKNRGVRDKVAIMAKGAHTPFCNPRDLAEQLGVTLDRLQMDYVDIYMMHRDNPEIPVGEFIDCLNQHVRAGRMRAFGGSNWTRPRIEAASAYAKANGLQGFSAVSNNFSLARMVDPVWAGCIQASDPAWREWLTRRQFPLMPWSSQARGFFAGRADPKDLSDRELVRCWYSEDNFRRLARAEELARKKGALPIQIALAYVLCQPFPTFPLIGPRTPAETRTSLPALDIDLAPDELRWLNLEA